MKVLIVVDMQNDFIDGSLGTKEAVGIVDRVAEVMDSFDGAVSAPEIPILRIIWKRPRAENFR